MTVQPMAATPATRPARDLLGGVYAGLDGAAVRWCLLRGGADGMLPDRDVDLLVARADLPRAVAVLRACGTVPLASSGRGSHRFFLGFDPGMGSFVELDVVSELAFGRHFVLASRAEGACLDGRRREGAAWVLRQEDEFWALLLHCMLDKRAVGERHAQRLAELAGSASLDSPLVRALPDRAGLLAGVLAAARAGAWATVTRNGDTILRQWRREHPLEVARRSVRGSLLRTAERPMQAWSRRGLSVALLGPDGAGKSTLAQGVEKSFCFPVRCVYMGLWQRRETVSGAHRVVLDVALRPFVVWRRYLASLGYRAIGRLVIFDRYVYDALVPPTGPLVRLKRPYFWLLGRLCPAPDLVLLLDVPGAVMHARKGERDAERLEAERDQFLRLQRRLPNAERVDADRPPEVVLVDVLGRIWLRYAKRSLRGMAR